jgi:hypothetical protein
MLSSLVVDILFYAYCFVLSVVATPSKESIPLYKTLMHIVTSQYYKQITTSTAFRLY